MALLIKTSGNVKCRFSYLSKLISGFIRFIMGNLLKILSRNDSEYCCVSVPDNVFVDFENSKPKEDEVQVYNLADAVLKEGAIILEDIKNYKGNIQNVFREISLHILIKNIRYLCMIGVCNSDRALTVIL